jgi:hypothetical protein
MPAKSTAGLIGYFHLTDWCCATEEVAVGKKINCEEAQEQVQEQRRYSLEFEKNGSLYISN